MAERRVDAGLAAGIFLLPQVFGWTVLREGYGAVTRILVFTYMILSSIPLYFLVVTLWNSGGDLFGMARDYDRNRLVTERNIGEAKGYMDDYRTGDLRPTETSPPPAPTAAAPVAMTSVALAREAEKGAAAILALRSRTITVTGRATADSVAGRIYLEGTDTYPAVTLQAANPDHGVASGEQVALTCSGPTMGTAGPELRDCR